MKNDSAIAFYSKVCLWILFCAFVALVIIPTKINLEVSGNESDALYLISIIHRSQKQYAEKNSGKFAPNFDELNKTILFDERFSGEKPVVTGYIFEMKVSESTSDKPAFYSINADPQFFNLFYKTGIKHFYNDSTFGTIKGTEKNRQANANDASI
jgi:hypothetical protein